MDQKRFRSYGFDRQEIKRRLPKENLIWFLDGPEGGNVAALRLKNKKEEGSFNCVNIWQNVPVEDTQFVGLAFYVYVVEDNEHGLIVSPKIPEGYEAEDCYRYRLTDEGYAGG